MTGFIGIGILIALFLVFPLVAREKTGGCGGDGCWKRRLGVGCGDCPLDRPSGSGEQPPH